MRSPHPPAAAESVDLDCRIRDYISSLQRWLRRALKFRGTGGARRAAEVAEARDGKAVKRIAWAIFVMLFVSYCYFIQNPSNWNSIPRVALALSIIEDGSLAIDKYRLSTGDLAFYNGRFYSDKAPGLTFMSLPAIAAARLYLISSYEDTTWLGYDGNVTLSFVFLEQWAIMITSALVTALTAVAVFYVSLRLGAGLPGAVFAALSYGLATPAWGWATAFFGHNPAGGFLFLGFAAVFYLSRPTEDARRDMILGFAAGALLSWAVVIEYTSAPVSAFIAVYGIASARKWPRERIVRILVPALAGALVFIAPLLLYNHAVTGSMFETAYKQQTSFPRMGEGFYGLELGSLQHMAHVLVSILFRREYGLFWLSPLLLAAPLGLYAMWRTPGVRAAAVLLTTVPLYYLLWNSTYVYWAAGGTTGPRYLVPMLPFLCLPLSLLWEHAGRILRGALLALFVPSFLISLVCVAISMTRQFEPREHALMDHLIPAFVKGELYQLSYFVWLLVPDSLRPGFSGQLSLVPLYAVLAAGGIYIALTLRKAGRTSRHAR